jgi:hypothetical protein
MDAVLNKGVLNDQQQSSLGVITGYIENLKGRDVPQCWKGVLSDKVAKYVLLKSIHSQVERT